MSALVAVQKKLFFALLLISVVYFAYIVNIHSGIQYVANCLSFGSESEKNVVLPNRVWLVDDKFSARFISSQDAVLFARYETNGNFYDVRYLGGSKNNEKSYTTVKSDLDINFDYRMIGRTEVVKENELERSFVKILNYDGDVVFVLSDTYRYTVFDEKKSPESLSLTLKCQTEFVPIDDVFIN